MFLDAFVMINRRTASYEAQPAVYSLPVGREVKLLPEGFKRRGVKIMSRRLSKSDFCESCLEIGCGNDRSTTVEEILDSPGYPTLGYPSLNYTILYGLQDNGGCSSCIDMVESATGM